MARRHCMSWLLSLLVPALLLSGCGDGGGRGAARAPGAGDGLPEPAVNREDGDRLQAGGDGRQGAGQSASGSAGSGLAGEAGFAPAAPASAQPQPPGTRGGLPTRGAGLPVPGAAGATALPGRPAAPNRTAWPEPTLPALELPASSAEAREAVVVFARDELGLAVEPVYAGAATADVEALLAMLPAEIQAALAGAPDMAAAVYYALLPDGAAGVSVGDCSAGSPCTVSGDIELALSSASLGAYALAGAGAPPAGPEAALDLVERTFPALAGLPFSPAGDDSVPGYLFFAQTTRPGRDENGHPIAITRAVMAGTAAAGSVTVVYAAVGVGAYSGSLAPR